MATRRRRKQKNSDETLVDIVEVKDQAQDYLETNQRLILGLLTLAVLLVGGYLAYKNFYKAPREKTASTQMWQAQYQFERDSFALALTNPGNGYEGFLDIIDNYGGTKAANLANYYAGVSYLHLGQYDVAISFLKDFNPAGDVTPAMKYGTMGDAQAELQDYSAALSNYRKAADEAGENELIAPYYWQKVGLLLEKEGNTQEAIDIYKKVLDRFPTASSKTTFEKYLVRLGANS